jgi:ribosome-associated protein
MRVKSVKLAHYPVKLGQFLKLADVTSDGVEAKQLILSQKVFVNGCVETRRGRQLRQGDCVLVGKLVYRCA